MSNLIKVYQTCLSHSTATSFADFFFTLSEECEISCLHKLLFTQFLYKLISEQFTFICLHSSSEKHGKYCCSLGLSFINGVHAEICVYITLLLMLELIRFVYTLNPPHYYEHLKSNQTNTWQQQCRKSFRYRSSLYSLHRMVQRNKNMQYSEQQVSGW